MIETLGAVTVALLLQGPAETDSGPRNLQLKQDAVVNPEVIVPVGTAIPIALLNKISTKNAKDGDGVYARTIFPITVNNQIVIPEGSRVKGKISVVQRPGRVKGRAALALSFQTLILPNGTNIPIYASLGGASGAGERVGEATIKGDSSKGEDARTIGTTTATGAVIGGVASSDNSRGKGVGIGAGAGAAAGLATVLLTRGKDLVLEPGATLEIVLDRPLEP
jgi:hypothetical protein